MFLILFIKKYQNEQEIITNKIGNIKKPIILKNKVNHKNKLDQFEVNIKNDKNNKFNKKYHTISTIEYFILELLCFK